MFDVRVQRGLIVATIGTSLIFVTCASVVSLIKVYLSFDYSIGSGFAKIQRIKHIGSNRTLYGTSGFSVSHIDQQPIDKPLVDFHYEQQWWLVAFPGESRTFTL